MLPIRWNARALDKLDELIAYIAERSPSAAEELQDRIEAAVLPASEHPYMFRAGRVPSTREIIAHPNYIVVYRVLSDRIQVLSVLHAHQFYP